MILKLHLTREELVFLSYALKQRQMLLSHMLDQEQPDPLSAQSRKNMVSALKTSIDAAEKIRLLIAYSDRVQDLINAHRNKPDDVEIARDRVNQQKMLYFRFALNNPDRISDLDPFPDDQDLEIPDPV